MSSKQPANRSNKAITKRRSARSKSSNLKISAQRTHPGTLIQQAKSNLLSPREVLQLQRTIGNRATAQLLTGAAQRQPVNPEKEVTQSPSSLPQFQAAPRSIQRMQAYDEGQGDRVIKPENANQVPGEAISVRTNAGSRVVAWRPQRGPQPAPSEEELRRRGQQKVDGAKYRESLFCHGFSLGTFGQFGYSVFSGADAMGQVLQDEFTQVGDLKNGADIQPGDLAVWFKGADPVHSAVVVQSIVDKKGRVDIKKTTVDSKTGTGQLMKNWPLQGVMRQYVKEGKDIHFFRR